eukprot:1098286-Pleurochrysis_carterae.AAC.3
MPDEERCPAWHRACGEAAITLRPGRPGRRPGGARRPPSRLRRLVQGNAAKRAASWHLTTAGSEALAASGTRSFKDPRAAANGAPERLQRRRSWLSVSRAAESSTAAKVARYPRARRRARKKSYFLDQGGGRCSAEQLRESRVLAAENSSKGNKERHPSTGHSHRVVGEVRGTAQRGASFSESRGGRYSKRWRREGDPGLAVRRARQRGQGQVVPPSGQCRRWEKTEIVRVFRGRAEAELMSRGGRWVVRRLPLGRAAGAAGRRRRPLDVLEASGPAQQLELGLGWAEAEGRRARYEQHKPRTHRAGLGAAGNQPNSSGGDEQRWPAARATKWGSARAEAVGAAIVL